MSRIAARKPFYVTNQSDITKDLTVRLKIADIDASYPADYQYLIQKKKYSTDSELLSVDISKFIRDHFEHNLIPNANYQQQGTYHTLKVTATVNGVATEYIAYDGYEDVSNSTVASPDTIRPIYVGSPAILEALVVDNNTVKWGVVGGGTSTVSMVKPTNSEVVAFIQSRSGLTGADTEGNRVWVENYSGGVSWKRYADLVCPYNDTYTIQFINRYGLWDYIDVTGRIYHNRRATSKKYLSSLGYTRDINRVGTRTLKVSVGIVQPSFSPILEDLLMSERITLWDGTNETPLVLTTASIEELETRGYAVNVPEIEFEFANPIIPIV